MSDSKPTHWKVRAFNDRECVTQAGEGAVDELVIDEWFHLEEMHPDRWWMRIGDARLTITRTGRQIRLDIERGSYGPRNGETTEHHPQD
jgi:hypothetical protein